MRFATAPPAGQGCYLFWGWVRYRSLWRHLTPEIISVSKVSVRFEIQGCVSRADTMKETLGGSVNNARINISEMSSAKAYRLQKNQMWPSQSCLTACILLFCRAEYLQFCEIYMKLSKQAQSSWLWAILQRTRDWLSRFAIVLVSCVNSWRSRSNPELLGRR